MSPLRRCPDCVTMTRAPDTPDRMCGWPCSMFGFRQLLPRVVAKLRAVPRFWRPRSRAPRVKIPLVPSLATSTFLGEICAIREGRLTVGDDCAPLVRVLRAYQAEDAQRAADNGRETSGNG